MHTKLGEIYIPPRIKPRLFGFVVLLALLITIFDFGAPGLIALSWIVCSLFTVSLLQQRPWKVHSFSPSDQPQDVIPAGRLLTLWSWFGIVASVVLITAYMIEQPITLNPDSFAYMRIADLIASGQFVIRGYWSPLLSWLMAPGIALGWLPEYSGSWVLFVSCIITLFATRRLAAHLGVGKLTQPAVMLTTSAVLIQILPTLQADILGTAAFCVYGVVVTHPCVRTHPLCMGILTGIAAAVMYFAKSYSLPFFLVHVPLICIIMIWGYQHFRREAAVFALTSLVTCGVIIAPYLILLNQRYGYFTISTAAQLTRGLIAPGYTGWIVCNDGTRLCAEPTDVLFPWEDHPVSYQPDYDWSPFQSTTNLVHQLAITGTNIFVFVQHKVKATVLLAVPLALIAALLFKRSQEGFAFVWLSATILLYAGGYMITWAGPLRYYLPLLPLCVMIIALLIERVFLTQWHPRNSATAYLSVAALTAVLLLVYSKDNLARNLVQNAGSSIFMPSLCGRESADELKPYLEAPFAGAHRNPYSHWNIVQEVSYYTGLRTYGALYVADNAIASVDTTLHDYGIQSLLIQNDDDLAMQFVGLGYSTRAHVQTCDGDYYILSVDESVFPEIDRP